MKTQFWLVPPLAPQVISWVPSSSDWSGSSRALPPVTRVWVPLSVALTAQVKDVVPVAVPEEAVTVTVEDPAVLGVPEMRPAELMDRPAGRPVAVKVRDLPAVSLAVSWSETAVLTLPDWLPGLVTETVSEAGPVWVRVRVCSLAVRAPPTELPVVLVQLRVGVVSVRRPESEERPITRPLYRLTRRKVPVGVLLVVVPGMTHHCCPTLGPPDPAAVTVGWAPQARPAVAVELTPSSWPVEELAIR